MGKSRMLTSVDRLILPLSQLDNTLEQTQMGTLTVEIMSNSGRKMHMYLSIAPIKLHILVRSRSIKAVVIPNVDFL